MRGEACLCLGGVLLDCDTLVPPISPAKLACNIDAAYMLFIYCCQRQAQRRIYVGVPAESNHSYKSEICALAMLHSRLAIGGD